MSEANPEPTHDSPYEASNHPSLKPYVRFFAMIATSAALMFVLMYAHSWRLWDHAYFSETRLFMTLLMAGSMTIVMLAFMLSMYPSRAINLGIFALAGLLMLAAVGLVRTQTTVTGVDYMEGMIPHHSIAILTSERADIQDPRVRELADKIIAAQVREIREMQWLIDDIQENGIAEDDAAANARAVPDF
jgi:hypothetical protein